MPSKRQIRFIVILFSIVFILLLIFFNLQRIGNFAIKRSLGILQKNLGAKLNYATVTGDIFQNPSFNKIRLIFPGGDSIVAQKVSFYYNPLSLLSGKFLFSNIELKSPEIYWHSAKTKMAKLTAKPRTIATHSLPVVTIPTLVLTDGKIFLDSELRMENIQTVISLRANKKILKVNLQRLSFQLLKENLKLKDAKGIISFDGVELKVDTLNLRTNQSQAVLKGKVNLTKPEYEIQIRDLSLDMAELIKQQGKLNIKGRVNISKTGIKGKVNLISNNLKIENTPLPNCRADISCAEDLVNYTLKTIDPVAETIEAKGEVNLTNLSYQGEFRFRNFSPISFVPGKIPQLQMDGVISFSGVKKDTIKLQLKSRLREFPVDSLFLAATMAKNNIKVSQIKLTKDNKELTLAGSLNRTNIKLSYNLNNFPLTFAEKLVNLKASGNITGKGELAGNYDSLAVSTDFSITRGNIEQFNFAKLQLNFASSNVRRFFSKQVGIYPNQIKNLNLSVDTLIFGKREIGNLVLQVKDTTFDLLVKNTDLALASNGRILFNKNSYQSMVDYFSLTRAEEVVRAKRPFRVEKTNQQFNLTGFQCDFAGGELNLDLSFKEITQPNIQLELTNIDLSKLRKFLGYKSDINGLINLDLKTNNNYQLSFTVGDFKDPNSVIDLKSLEGEIAVTKNEIKINKLNLTNKKEISTISGAINYAWEPKTRAFTMGNLALKATLADPGIWILSFLKGILDVKSGNIYGTIEAKGDVRNPIFSGRARVNDAKMLIVATNSTAEKVNAELLFDRNRIVLTKIIGQVGKGLITGSGWTELQRLTTVKALQYDITGQDLPIHPQKDVYAIVNGSLQIAWQQNQPTSLIGNITVKEALLTIGFGSEVKSGSASNLIYNMTVKGERGIWLRNSYCDIELSTDLNLRKTLTETFYSGELSTRQGNFYYLDHNLTMTEGSIKFDNINELNPDLDLNAEMYTRSMKINSETPERVKIKLQMTGTLKQPVFNFSSEPSVLSQDDILSYLTLNVIPQEISVAEQRQVFNKLISERFLGYFEREIAKKLRNYIRLDYLQFESGLFEGGKTAKVTVGKYIAQNLYATYTHNISGFTQDIFKVEYYITKSHELVGERDEQGRYRLKYQFKFRY
jgi:autotransporter translocation and assembly factor TamB